MTTQEMDRTDCKRNQLHRHCITSGLHSTVVNAVAGHQRHAADMSVFEGAPSRIKVIAEVALIVLTLGASILVSDVQAADAPAGGEEGSC